MSEKIAPVQGYSAGIPWSMHLRAYDAYCKRYGPQEAMIDLEGRGCRGGFHTSELDLFIPGWREELSELAGLRRRLAEALDQLGTVSAWLGATRAALATVAYLDVTNLGTESESNRPARYFECRLCGDWNDEAKHIEHADGCPLRLGFPRTAAEQRGSPE